MIPLVFCVFLAFRSALCSVHAENSTVKCVEMVEGSFDATAHYSREWKFLFWRLLKFNKLFISLLLFRVDNEQQQILLHVATNLFENGANLQRGWMREGEHGSCKVPK